MSKPTPAQIRAARGMLNWSMLDLAKAAGVSISTVKRFECEGDQPVSADTVGMMQDAAETEGVRFLADDGNGPGVRLRRR
ncbi:helix-turn-helix transcriptional regulator [Lichenibacterium dinghuense]|uniref:helix-turn-helix domain-containing protein n=1 Tax=Lichenibacterium dinghuense TaxID=2895977 RepID=UPI0031450F81